MTIIHRHSTLRCKSMKKVLNVLRLEYKAFLYRHFERIGNDRGLPFLPKLLYSPNKNNADRIYIRFSRPLFSSENPSPISLSSQSNASLKFNWYSISLQRIKPYWKLARLNAPIGTWLLFWPCAWSIGLAAQPTTILPSLFYLCCCGAGAILMRSSGCVINDIWDRELDGKVERTHTRPIACGEISVKQAFLFLGAQLGLSLAILMQFKPLTILLGLSSMALVVVYPLMKRIIDWPQFVLGLTFNWGALLGWTAVSGSFSSPVLLPLCLYSAGVCWTLVYDTLYAHQDKDDDKMIGIRSTALKWGENNKKIMSFFTALMGLFLLGVGYIGELHWPFYLSTLATTASLGYMLKVIDLDDKIRCGKFFRYQKWVGLMVFLGILFSKMITFSLYYDLNKEIPIRPVEEPLDKETK